jgi:hypothetical protein
MAVISDLSSYSIRPLQGSQLIWNNLLGRTITEHLHVTEIFLCPNVSDRMVDGYLLFMAHGVLLRGDPIYPAPGGRITAATGGLAAGQHTPNDRRGAAHTRIHGDRVEIAVHCTGPAFHASVPVPEHGPLLGHFENAVRANFNAPTAAGALIRGVLQGGYV